MLQRVLEPEIMDSAEEAADYDAMEHAEVNRQFVRDLLAAGPVADEILDLGVGTAQIPIALCQSCVDCRVLGIDMAVSMLRVAGINIEIAGLRERIMLDRQDAKGLPYKDGRFTAVISNSIIHHIPQPQRVIAEAIRVVAESGLLFFRDLLRPENDQMVENLVEKYAGYESPHARQMFEDSLRAALSLDEVRQLVSEFGFAADGVQQTTDRHWTWIARQEK